MSKNKNKDLDFNDEIDLEIDDLNNSNGEKDELDDLFNELDIKEKSEDFDEIDLDEIDLDEMDLEENSKLSKEEEFDFDDFEDFDEKQNSSKDEKDAEDFDEDNLFNDVSLDNSNNEFDEFEDEEKLESTSSNKNINNEKDYIKDEDEDDFDLESELGLIDEKVQNELDDVDELFDTKTEEQKEISDLKKSRQSENDFLKTLDDKSSDLKFYDDSEKEETQSDLMADILNIDSQNDYKNKNKDSENKKNDNTIKNSYVEAKKEEVRIEKVEDKKLKEETKESSAKKILSLKPSIKNNSYSIKGILIGVSAILSISAILSGSYLFKDEIFAKIQGQNIVAENIEEQSKLFSSKFVEKEKFNKSVNDFNELNLKYENLSQLSLKLESISQAQAVKLRELFAELEVKDTHLNQLKGLVNTNDAIISEFNKKVDNQKEMLTKAIKLTLGVIDENKEINKKNAEEIYNKVFSELKTELTTEKSKLYDFSIMEERLSSVLSSNKEILNEVIEVKKENVRLRSKVSKLEAQVKDERIDPQANESSVIDMLTNDNQKEKNEKISSGIEITKKKSKSQENDNLPLYNIIGIVEGIAYILPEGARSKNDLTVYKVNDFISGYGRILRITDSQIIAEKGVVKKK